MEQEKREAVERKNSASIARTFTDVESVEQHERANELRNTNPAIDAEIDIGDVFPLSMIDSIAVMAMNYLKSLSVLSPTEWTLIWGSDPKHENSKSITPQPTIEVKVVPNGFLEKLSNDTRDEQKDFKDMATDIEDDWDLFEEI